mmetsp:Transcript_30216/g.35403  ORF Transcript_30216/g.35403 Transcript_30216/m.35403 type:complete len:194 (+) Transcript_30216:1060-1641(+)
MCRTRIEKNKGCNHMTCGLCGYEFCWACGASATSADNHFGFMRGCGVGMMDESVKPGDARARSPCKQICTIVFKVLCMIILYPFFLVFYMPFACAYGAGLAGHRVGGGCLGALIFGFFGFIIGLILNICFIPFILIVTFCFLLVMIFRCFRCICCRRCHCDDPEQARRAEEENRRNAEQELERRKALGKDGKS